MCFHDHCTGTGIFGRLIQMTSLQTSFYVILYVYIYKKMVKYNHHQNVNLNSIKTFTDFHQKTLKYVPYSLLFQRHDQHALHLKKRKIIALKIALSETFSVPF